MANQLRAVPGLRTADSASQRPRRTRAKLLEKIIVTITHGLRIAAILMLVLGSASQQAHAQDLNVPMTGHRAHPIAAETLFHTLFSDFFSERDGTTYVQTGDIPAMWLRDSSAQTTPYVRFVSSYPILSERLLGVIERDARNIAVDPYANAFRADYRVWEEKWEPDSLAWPILLAWVYHERTLSKALFTGAFHRALRIAVDTWRCEQLHPQCSGYHPPYRTRSSEPINAGTGMIWCAFRPSDDAVLYHFNIPQEMIVAIALRDVAALALAGYRDTNLANEASSISAQIQNGVLTYGRVWRRDLGGWVYLYETDGLGGQLFADDANLPSLISMPYIGWSSAIDPAYLNTRSFALSHANPWYYSGTYAAGLGSQHTPVGFVWPLGIIARALTATSSLETAAAVTTLAETDSRDGLIHESFDANAYWVFTRAEFGWANALYAEIVFRSLAGFNAMPFTPNNAPMEPFEQLSTTPRLATPLLQIYNGGLIFGALDQLLSEADGRTIIPRTRAIMSRTSGSGPRTL